MDRCTILNIYIVKWKGTQNISLLNLIEGMACLPFQKYEYLISDLTQVWFSISAPNFLLLSVSELKKLFVEFFFTFPLISYKDFKHNIFPVLGFVVLQKKLVGIMVLGLTEDILFYKKCNPLSLSLSQTDRQTDRQT